MKILFIFKKLFLLLSTAITIYADSNFICYDKWPDASPPYHFTPNKCGPDSPLADIIPNHFGSVDLSYACNTHDRCWMELKELNQYGRCEIIFTKDLIKACNTAKLCVDIKFSEKCVPNPIEIMACQSIIVPSYTSASMTSAFLQRLQKTRDEQKKFERCVAQYGYNKR